MTESAIQAEAIAVVCTRFLHMKKTTPRRLLVLKFHSPDAISQLVKSGLVRTVGAPDDEHYLPRAASFSLVNDPQIRAYAKTAAITALHVLRNLYEVELEKDTFSYDDVLQHAQKIFDTVEPDSVKLGLYLCQDFNVFTSWSSSNASMEVASFRLAERIISINPEEAWDALLQRLEMLEPAIVETPYAHSVSAADTDDSRTIDWSLIHQAVTEVAESRFQSGHFADSVEAALKSVNERVRDIVKQVLGSEMDGSDLMQRAFSLKSPVLKLGNLDTITGRSMQVGYMQIFAGSMTGIRNPKAHGNVVIDLNRAMHFLFLASLLMYKLDEAEVCKPEQDSQNSVC
jgi:uncharacterized protein (TIGR02391 family)